MRADRSNASLNSPAPVLLLGCLTSTAWRSFGDLLGWQNRVARQMLTNMQQQQQAKTDVLEAWLNQRAVILQNTLEEGVHASKDLYIASGNAQADWLQASERLLTEANRNLLQTIKQLSPCGSLPAAAMQPVCSAMTVGSCAVESMSKATRQVTHFASTNLGNAAVNAVRVAREELAAHQPGARQHH